MLPKIQVIRTFLICAVLIIPGLAMAQKMEKPQIDKFTNDTAFFTTTEKVANNKSSLSSSAEDIEAYASKKKGAMFFHLKVELTVMDHKFFRVSAGNKIILKLSDNTLFTLTNTNDQEAKREGVGPRITGRLCWTVDLGANIVKADIAKISSSAITAIRIQTDQGDVDFDIKPKNSDVIKKMLSLILNAS